MACDLILSIFVCGNAYIFKSIIYYLFHLEGVALNIAGMVVSSLMIYAMAKIAGKVGGAILFVLGLVGTVFTGGVSLVLTMFGTLIGIFSHLGWLIALLNAAMFLFCIYMGCI